jgi:hypothetical protein
VIGWWIPGGAGCGSGSRCVSRGGVSAVVLSVKLTVLVVLDMVVDGIAVVEGVVVEWVVVQGPVVVDKAVINRVMEE